MNKIIVILAVFLPMLSWALPIDWHGKFGVDSSIVDKYRFVESSAATTGNDSMAVDSAAGGLATSSVQSYVFSLLPEMIINDAATFKAEITSGYGRGGLLGTDTATSKAPTTTGNTLFLNNESTGGNTLSMSQFYLELYSDLATYKVGRHSKDWGLGALYNSGANLWDRHTFAYDGVTMNFKLNNFKISPFWARVNTGNGLTRINHTKEYGLSLLYDNVERDIAIGVLYAKKQNGSQAVAYTGTDGVTSLQNNDVKVLDIYFKTIWSDLTLEIEAPIVTGSLGVVYPGVTSSYDAKAILVNTSYQWSDAFKVALNIGHVSGDDASTTGEFSAMYLNPNYKIGNILFAYNPMAVADPSTYSYFDAYVTNAQYVALSADYQATKWNFKGSVLYAKALEVATSGKLSFNHLKNKTFTAAANQADDLGIEFDFNSTYQWNTEISLQINAGYLLTGDYFGFNNTATPNATSNTWMLQFGLGVQF